MGGLVVLFVGTSLYCVTIDDDGGDVDPIVACYHVSCLVFEIGGQCIVIGNWGRDVISPLIRGRHSYL